MNPIKGDPRFHGGGLCAQTDPEAFFPEKGESSKPAKAVCARCPIRRRCLSYALEHRVRYGVWGGLSERERRQLLKAMDADTAGETAA